MTTIHLPPAVPLIALQSFADSLGCTLHHAFGDGYYLRPRDPLSETGLIRAISLDLCAAWKEGGARAINYLFAANQMAKACGDYAAAEELYMLWAMLMVSKTQVAA